MSIKESKKRGAKFHTDLTSPKSWKLVLIITHDSVWYKDEISGITKKIDVLQNGKTFRISRRYFMQQHFGTTRCHELYFFLNFRQSNYYGEASHGNDNNYATSIQ